MLPASLIHYVTIHGGADLRRPNREMVGRPIERYSSRILTSASRAQYIEPSRVSAFTEACAEVDTGNVGDVLQPFFATWTTSLMGSDLEKLRAISADLQLRALVETLVVQDECNIWDPFSVSELPSPDSKCHIWARDDTSSVIISNLGIAELQHILRERLLHPKTIIIRDYQIGPSNLHLEELAHLRHLVYNNSCTAENRVPLAALAKDIVDGANLDIESLQFRHVDSGFGFTSILSSAEFLARHPGESVCSPMVTEAVIGVDVAYQGQVTRFSKLRSADLWLGQEATSVSYWLEQVFYDASKLKRLHLLLRASQCQQLEAGKVVPGLEEFTFRGRISAEDLLAIMSSSKQTLRHIDLRMVTLNQGSTWGDVLLFVAKSYRALGSFTISLLRESDDSAPCVDWREIQDNIVLERYRAGLEYRARGPDGNKRITRLSYTGIDAGKVLEIIAACGYVPESLESGKRPA